jgi:uridine kinase
MPSQTPPHSPEQRILEKLAHLRTHSIRPVVVALDGGSGAGKSTIAERLIRLTGATLVPLDVFYQTRIPETAWPSLPIEERFQRVFDWPRIREVLISLRSGRPGRWQAIDFLAGLGPNGAYRLKSEWTEVPSAACVVLEGAYSAAPFLRDLIDLSVLIDVPAATRHRRTSARDDTAFQSDWHVIWDEVEETYFTRVCPPESFDLVVENT